MPSAFLWKLAGVAASVLLALTIGVRLLQSPQLDIAKRTEEMAAGSASKVLAPEASAPAEPPANAIAGADNMRKGRTTEGENQAYAPPLASAPAPGFDRTIDADAFARQVIKTGGIEVRVKSV